MFKVLMKSVLNHSRDLFSFSSFAQRICAENYFFFYASIFQVLFKVFPPKRELEVYNSFVYSSFFVDFNLWQLLPSYYLHGVLFTFL